MTRPHDTFGGVWTRPDHSGRGHNQRELQDRAGYDQAPASTGCGALLFLLLTVITALLGALA